MEIRRNEKEPWGSNKKAGSFTSGDDQLWKLYHNWKWDPSDCFPKVKILIFFTLGNFFFGRKTIDKIFMYEKMAKFF